MKLASTTSPAFDELGDAAVGAQAAAGQRDVGAAEQADCSSYPRAEAPDGQDDVRLASDRTFSNCTIEIGDRVSDQPNLPVSV
jgi:hypothetical protein